MGLSMSSLTAFSNSAAVETYVGAFLLALLIKIIPVMRPAAIRITPIITPTIRFFSLLVIVSYLLIFFSAFSFGTLTS